MSEIARTAYSAPFAKDQIRPIAAIPPLDDLTPEWAWGGGDGAGVRVAVIDSGIDADHPAVGSVSGYVAITQDTESLVFTTEPHRDLYGHGTACAGIIRALAPGSELYSVRVLGPGLTGRGAIFAAGLRWALDNGMQVCNLSLGTTRRDFYAALHELADEAYFRRVVLVAAANNLPTPSFPSLYASVISVASHAEPQPDRYYYNSQPPVEFGALGCDVRVAWRDGSWLTATGNSFAAPHIAGLVARILGKHPDLQLFQVKSILRALAANVVHP